MTKQKIRAVAIAVYRAKQLTPSGWESKLVEHSKYIENKEVRSPSMYFEPIFGPGLEQMVGSKSSALMLYYFKK